MRAARLAQGSDDLGSEVAGVVVKGESCESSVTRKPEMWKERKGEAEA